MKKDKKKERSKNPKEDTQPKRIADIKEGTYSDGHPLDDVQYLECKIILKGDRFTSVESFYDFAKIVKRAAENADVGFSTKGFKGLLPQIREVLFVDTEDYKLYNNAFILRRRIPYEHGFLAGDPEIVFKFRHPDMQKTADLDVRPKLISDYRIKFKAEMLPLKDEIGGLRMLYSHNVQFPMSQVHEADRASMATLLRVFPPLQALQTSASEELARSCWMRDGFACQLAYVQIWPLPEAEKKQRAINPCSRDSLSDRKIRSRRHPGKQ